MTIQEFSKDIEHQKKQAYNKAWYILVGGLDKKITNVQADIAKYIINRVDGMPTQKIGGEKDGEPIKINLINYGNYNPIQVPAKMVSDPNSTKSGEIQSDSNAPKIWQNEDNPEPADKPGTLPKGNVSLPPPDLQAGKESNLAGPGNDGTHTGGDN